MIYRKPRVTKILKASLLEGRTNYVLAEEEESNNNKKCHPLAMPLISRENLVRIKEHGRGHMLYKHIKMYSIANNLKLWNIKIP